MRPALLCVSTRALMPLLLLFSIFLLLRGHNDPGGGFVGGLTAAAAFGLHALAFGVAETRRTLRFDVRGIMGVGLLLALLSGVLGMLGGGTFLTARWLDFPFPVIGKLGTPVLFDIGVYLAVLGVTLGILLPLIEED